MTDSPSIAKLDPKTDGSSANILEQNIDQLRQLYPEVFTESSDPDGPRWKVDFDSLRELLGNFVEESPERYSFNWHGKSRAKRIAQTPSTGTLRPCLEESVNWETTQNIVIEGDNLEILKLLQKSYHKRVKMIYIDPPYNTGNEFIYPDKFQDNLDTYLRYTGQAGEDGIRISANSESGGRYHTNWLNMMYPRLKLARNLLRDDGVIFISIDDIEVANLTKMCDEVFGEENHVANIVWQKRYVSNVTAKWLSDMHDYVLMYARNKESLAINDWKRTDEQLEAYRNPDDDPRGRWRAQDLSASKPYTAGQFTIAGPTGKEFTPPPNRYWRCSEEQFKKWQEDNRIWWGVNSDARPMLKSFLDESERGIKPHTWWNFGFAGHNKEATLELKQLFDGDSPFDTPKPVKLMRRLIELVCDDDSLLMDFFAGSASLAQAALEHSAETGAQTRFILCQLPEPTERDDHPTIASIAIERIKRALKGINDKKLGFRVFKLASSNIARWHPGDSAIDKALLSSVNSIIEGRSEQDIVTELMIKFGLDLSGAIECHEVGADRIYVLGAGALVICLAKHVTPQLVDDILAISTSLHAELSRFVFVDSGFKDDVAKTNAIQILRQHGIEDVKTI